ncbi:MAG: hypothetical protein F6K40_10285 [Okeania sp. SIO3I5]|uniref:hypothetical protein n=1 Tax=Okeania sp. SIO3I5 TaxID=2607805 RepID=UPI0013B6E146|nr:hypothetical protein [Okeania sp. SIO3I5]NEQ36643.1 hypothetical protein [Okeania sp. SIO3I5]
MSEDQLQQPNSEQPETTALSQETTETPDVASATQPQEEPMTENESVMAKPGLKQQVLRLVRSLLPESLSQNLSDELLTGAIAGIFALILVIIFVSFPSSQPTTEVADISVVEESELTEAIAPEESLASTIDSENIEISDSALPEAPESIEPVTPPPPKLTPEQIFLVSIQNQIDDLANQYGGGIVESLKFDFPSNLLIAELSNDWYDLTQEEQDELVDKMFGEIQDLDFKKLTLINSQSKIVARTSVTDFKMVVLERSLFKLPG